MPGSSASTSALRPGDATLALKAALGGPSASDDRLSAAARAWGLAMNGARLSAHLYSQIVDCWSLSAQRSLDSLFWAIHDRLLSVGESGILEQRDLSPMARSAELQTFVFSHQNRALFVASGAANLQLCQKLIDQGARGEPDASFVSTFDPLARMVMHSGCDEARIAKCAALLAPHADRSLRFSANALSHLMLAAKKGSVPVVEALWPVFGDTFLWPSPSGDTALSIACSSGQPSCARWMAGQLAVEQRLSELRGIAIRLMRTPDASPTNVSSESQEPPAQWVSRWIAELERAEIHSQIATATPSSGEPTATDIGDRRPASRL